MKKSHNKNEVSKMKPTTAEGDSLRFCDSCNKVQPTELTLFNPDEDTEPTLRICSVCKEAVDFEYGINNWWEET